MWRRFFGRLFGSGPPDVQTGPQDPAPGSTPASAADPTAPGPRPPAAWRRSPPIPTTVQRAGHDLLSVGRLASQVRDQHRSPASLATLGHRVEPRSPGGVVTGLARSITTSAAWVTDAAPVSPAGVGTDDLVWLRPPRPGAGTGPSLPDGSPGPLWPTTRSRDRGDDVPHAPPARATAAPLPGRTAMPRIARAATGRSSAVATTARRPPDMLLRRVAARPTRPDAPGDHQPTTGPAHQDTTSTGDGTRAGSDTPTVARSHDPAGSAAGPGAAAASVSPTSPDTTSTGPTDDVASAFGEAAPQGVARAGSSVDDERTVAPTLGANEPAGHAPLVGPTLQRAPDPEAGPSPVPNRPSTGLGRPVARLPETAHPIGQRPAPAVTGSGRRAAISHGVQRLLATRTDPPAPIAEPQQSRAGAPVADLPIARARPLPAAPAISRAREALMLAGATGRSADSPPSASPPAAASTAPLARMLAEEPAAAGTDAWPGPTVGTDAGVRPPIARTAPRRPTPARPETLAPPPTDSAPSAPLVGLGDPLVQGGGVDRSDLLVTDADQSPGDSGPAEGVAAPGPPQISRTAVPVRWDPARVDDVPLPFDGRSVDDSPIGEPTPHEPVTGPTTASPSTDVAVPSGRMLGARRSRPGTTPGPSVDTVSPIARSASATPSSASPDSVQRLPGRPPLAAAVRAGVGDRRSPLAPASQVHDGVSPAAKDAEAGAVRARPVTAAAPVGPGIARHLDSADTTAEFDGAGPVASVAVRPRGGHDDTAAVLRPVHRPTVARASNGRAPLPVVRPPEQADRAVASHATTHAHVTAATGSTTGAPVARRSDGPSSPIPVGSDGPTTVARAPDLADEGPATDVTNEQPEDDDFRDLYDRIRDELRWELRTQRERVGLLSDPQ